MPDGPVFTVLPRLPVDPKSTKVGGPRKTTVGVPSDVLKKRRKSRDTHALAHGNEIAVPKPSEALDVIPEDAEADMDDLAATVVRKTQRLLAAGKVNPTLRDGLTAQQLLDRRAEKAADRRFMLNLALAMAGGSVSAPQKYLPPPPEEAIEGEFTDLDLAPERLRKE